MRIGWHVAYARTDSTLHDVLAWNLSQARQHVATVAMFLPFVADGQLEFMDIAVFKTRRHVQVAECRNAPAPLQESG